MTLRPYGSAAIVGAALLLGGVAPRATAQSADLQDADVQDAGPQGSDLPFLQDVEIAEGTPTTVSIFLDRARPEGSAIGWFSLSDPERLVIDVADAAMGPDPLDLVEAAPPVQDVTAEEVEDPGGVVLRVTLFLEEPVDQEVEVLGREIRVDLLTASDFDDPLADAMNGGASSVGSGLEGTRELSGPDLPPDAPPTVSSLDFENLDDISRVVIGTNADLEFRASQPEPNLLVVDLPGADLAPSLERPLDTSRFISPVRLVRSYETRSGTRVAVNLSRSTEYSVYRASDRLIHLDVQVPEDMREDRRLARQSFGAAAPSTPATAGDQGLHSAYQKELLIGSSGRTSDPSTVFGAGAGASDPSSLMGMSAGFMFNAYTASDLPYSGKRINIDLVNADIHSVFRLISHVSKLNIVAGDDVSGRVTVRLENVPWDQAFAAILQAKGLGSQRFGNIVRIAPIETIKSEQQATLEAKRAADELEELQLYVVPLNYAQATELQQQVTSMLSGRGSLEVDSRSNQLIIRDTEKNLAKVRELVRQLDKQTPQVLIEARIVEASSGFSRGLGIEWGGEMNANASTGYSTGLFWPNTIGASGGIEYGSQGVGQFYSPGEDSLIADLGSPVGEHTALSLNLGSVTGLLDIDVRLSAMESEGWGKVISSPRVVTSDNETADITQGARIPYLSTSAAGTQVQFVTAALELSVTPHITSDNKVLLDVELANNRADFSQTVQGQPAIQIKEAKTALLVGDGDTKVIAGVYANEYAEAQDRIPFLSHIPLLGYLFKNSGTSVDRNEMLVFITPRILNKAVIED